MSEIKMADGSSLSIPDGATHLLNNCFARWIDNDSIAVIGNYYGATWMKTSRAMPRNAVEFSEISLLREKQNLVKQVADLELSLDDRDCYIADADMKNDNLAEQNKALMNALEQIKKHNETVTATPELSANWQIAARALEQAK